MKVCPTCDKRFDDASMVFCPEDGRLLSDLPADEATVEVNPPPADADLTLDDNEPTRVSPPQFEGASDGGTPVVSFDALLSDDPDLQRRMEQTDVSVADDPKAKGLTTPSASTATESLAGLGKVETRPVALAEVALADAALAGAALAADAATSVSEPPTSVDDSPLTRDEAETQVGEPPLIDGDDVETKVTAPPDFERADATPVVPAAALAKLTGGGPKKTLFGLAKPEQPASKGVEAPKLAIQPAKKSAERPATQSRLKIVGGAKPKMPQTRPLAQRRGDEKPAEAGDSESPDVAGLRAKLGINASTEQKAGQPTPQKGPMFGGAAAAQRKVTAELGSTKLGTADQPRNRRKAPGATAELVSGGPVEATSSVPPATKPLLKPGLTSRTKLSQAEQVQVEALAATDEVAEAPDSPPQKAPKQRKATAELASRAPASESARVSLPLTTLGADASPFDVTGGPPTDTPAPLPPPVAPAPVAPAPVAPAPVAPAPVAPPVAVAPPAAVVEEPSLVSGPLVPLDTGDLETATGDLAVPAAPPAVPGAVVSASPAPPPSPAVPAYDLGPEALAPEAPPAPVLSAQEAAPSLADPLQAPAALQPAHTADEAAELDYQDLMAFAGFKRVMPYIVAGVLLLIGGGSLALVNVLAPTTGMPVAGTQAEVARTEDSDKADGTKADETAAKSDEAAAKADEAKTDEAKTDEAKTDEAKTDEAKADGAKTDEAKADEAKADEAKTDEAKTDAAKAKADKAKADAAKAKADEPKMAEPAKAKTTSPRKPRAAQRKTPRRVSRRRSPRRRAKPRRRKKVNIEGTVDPFQ